MIAANKTAIVILAAGKGSRMQMPKQMLKWGNRTLLQHAIATAQTIENTHVYVVLGAYYDAVYQTIKEKPITILHNKEWNRGIGTSIATASQHIMHENKSYKGILFMLADQPFITSDYLQILIKDFKVNANAILATHYEPRNYGVPALFDKTYLEALSQLKDDEGAKQVMKRYINNVEIKMADIDVTDLDTKSEYDEAYHSKYLKTK